MKKILFTLLCVLPFLTFAQQDTLVKWTFPSGTSDSIADGGITVNQVMSLCAMGGTSSLTYPSGNTSLSASASKWNAGNGTKYWQIKVITLGYNTLLLSSKQKSSGTGPKDFKVQYMIGYAGTWTDVPNSTVLDSNNWNYGVLTNVPLPTACDNKDTVYVRWVMTSDISANFSTILSAGTSRIDDIVITGVSVVDLTPPTVLNAFATNLTNVKVVFSEAVDNTAEVITNYTGLGIIFSAIRNVTLDTVSLTLSTPLQAGVTYTLTISNIKDIIGNVMTTPQSFEIFYNSTIAEIAITEIMYNDPSAYSDSLEFIELYNNGSAQANISNYSFSSGIVYTFPANTTIAPNDYLVIAKDTNAVNIFFTISGTLQWTSGSLSNTGAKIEIINMAGDVIDSLTYKTTLPWPSTPNGDGPSLTLCNTSSDNSIGSNWQASEEFVDSLNHKAVMATPGAGCITTDIKKNHSANNYTVNCYPNPVSEALTITFNGQAKEIFVYDLIGNIVYKTNNISSTTTINTEKLNDGVYFIKIIFNDNTTITKKISVI